MEVYLSLQEGSDKMYVTESQMPIVVAGSAN